jgi:hypothetical protein
MARVSRLAGAILAETQGECFLIGNLKEPCDFATTGFEPPTEVDAMKRPYIRLTVKHEILVACPFLSIDLEGESLARLLAERLVIQRNGSVSERLWRLVMDPSGQDEPPKTQSVNGAWLAAMPAEIWQIVRDAVLRCL